MKMTRRFRQMTAMRWARGPLERRERGQALVEFVLVLPILLLLVIGIIEFANAWRTSQMITNITREGARMAVVPDSPTEAGVRDSLRTLLDNAGLDGSAANITLNLCTNCTGQPDDVTIEYPYEFIFFGAVINLIGGDGSPYGTITLASTSSMRNE